MHRIFRYSPRNMSNRHSEQKAFNFSVYTTIKSGYPVFSFEYSIESSLFNKLRDEFPLRIVQETENTSFFAEAHSNDNTTRLSDLIRHSKVWSDFVEQIVHGSFRSELVKFLLRSSSAWTTPFDFIKLLLRLATSKTFTTISLHIGVRGYHLAPHTDKADKIAALIIYMGSTKDAGTAHGGTTFYFPKSRQDGMRYLREISGMEHGFWRYCPSALLPITSAFLPRTYSSANTTNLGNNERLNKFYELHEPFFTSQFQPNTSVLFFKDQLTWHEVDLSKFPSHDERRSILINVYRSPNHLRRVVLKTIKLFKRD